MRVRVFFVCLFVFVYAGQRSRERERSREGCKKNGVEVKLRSLKLNSLAGFSCEKMAALRPPKRARLINPQSYTGYPS